MTCHYKYEICLDDIFNCFLGDFCNIFSEFIDFVFTPLCEKDFCFHEKKLRVNNGTFRTLVTGYP